MRVLPLLLNKKIDNNNPSLEQFFTKIKEVRDGFIHLKSETHRKTPLAIIVPYHQALPFKPSKVAAEVICLFSKDTRFNQFLL